MRSFYNNSAKSDRLLSCIFEFDRALEVLMTCSLRRANAQGKL
jgi:hypothetical protein